MTLKFKFCLCKIVIYFPIAMYSINKYDYLRHIYPSNGHGDATGNDHGNTTGSDHGKDHGKNHGKDHGKNHGKDHGNDYGNAPLNKPITNNQKPRASEAVKDTRA